LGNIIALENEERELPALLAPGGVEVKVLDTVVQILVTHRDPDLILPDALKVGRGEDPAKDPSACIEARGFH
jgi:hypothetical protein